MNIDTLIQAISVEDVDIDQFVRLITSEDQARDAIIQLMLTHPDIMVYYHCYYAVAKASLERPDLFMQYWHPIAGLLKHKNSYHRDFALTILANLTHVDHENLFAAIFQDYFEHIHDEKFMTGKCCIQNSMKIIRNKPELKNQILALLLNVDCDSPYSEKQMALMKSDVLEILDQVYNQIDDRNGASDFIRTCVASVSPKTQSKAKELVVKYRL